MVTSSCESACNLVMLDITILLSIAWCSGSSFY